MATKLQDLEGVARKAAADARAIIEKAGTEGREMTDAERAEVTDHMNKGRELLEQIKTVRADEAVLAEAKAIAELIGPAAAEDVEAQRDGTVGDPRSAGRKSLGQLVTESPQFKALFKQFGERIPNGVHVETDPIQVKSLFTGGSDTSGGAFVVADQSGILEMLGRRELTVRDLISVRRTTSDAIEYVRQTSHTNNAAPVAEATSSAAPTQSASTGPLVLNAGGGYKPEGAWAFERVTTNVKTIAEWVPATRRALADVAQLEGLINDELRADLAEAEENEIFNGDASGEHLDGITHVSGTQSQAWDTDFFTTTRKAKTKARVVGRVRPNGWVFSPGDVEMIELLKNNEGNFYNGGPFAQGQRTLWGYPYVDSEALSDGEGWLGDFKKVVLWDREQTTIRMTDSHADFFIRNLVAVLGEERVALGVTRPTALVAIDTAA